MAKYRLYQNKNVKSAGYEKWYAQKISQGLVTLDELIGHMVGHNYAYSEGVITGIVMDLVKCVRELAYEGKSVKIDNLGIFSVSMKSKGVEAPDDFNAGADITAKWQVRPTGTVMVKKLGVTRAAGATLTWQEDSEYISPRSKGKQAQEDSTGESGSGE